MADSYLDDVESYARSIIENEGLNDSNWHDAVHETVDNSSWIIYYGNNEDVLDATSNEPDADDVREMLQKDSYGDWQKVRQIAAFIAMERDLNEKLREIEDEYFECEDCGAVTREDDKHEHADGELCGECYAKRFRCDIGRESIDNPTVAVLLFSYELDVEPDSIKLTGEAATLTLGVLDGTTPIGVLFDKLTESPHEADTDVETLNRIVSYLRAKYPNGNEPWEAETFLEDDENEPVRLDMEHPEDEPEPVPVVEDDGQQYEFDHDDHPV